MPKKIRTYSISSGLSEWFDEYAKKHSINKSGFICNKIQDLRDSIEFNKPTENNNNNDTSNKKQENS